MSFDALPLPPPPPRLRRRLLFRRSRFLDFCLGQPHRRRGRPEDDGVDLYSFNRGKRRGRFGRRRMRRRPTRRGRGRRGRDRRRGEDLGEGQRQRAASGADDQQPGVPREESPPQQLLLPLLSAALLSFSSALSLFLLGHCLAQSNGRRRHRPCIARYERLRLLLFSSFLIHHQGHGLDVAVAEHQEAVPRRRRGRRGRRSP